MRSLCFILSLLCSLAFNKTLAQQNNIDSLKTALDLAKSDSARCVILNTLAETASDEEWPVFNDQLKTLAEKSSNSASNNVQKTFYLKYLASALNNRGIDYDNQGDIANALEYYHKALQIQEKIKDLDGTATSLNNIGTIFKDQGDVQKALEYFEKAITIQKQLHDKLGVANSLNNIGLIYYNQGNTSKALEYYDQSLQLKEELNDKHGIANSINNIALIYSNQGDYNKAIEYYQRSLYLYQDIDHKQGIAISLNNISDVLLKQGQLTAALDFATRSMQLSKELAYPENIRNAAERLKDIYEKQNKPKEALAMFELYIQMRDSINNEDTRKQSIKKQLQYQYEKKAAADSVKNSEEQKVKNAQLTAQQAQLKQEKTQRYALYSGLILILGFLIFVVNRFRITQKQKKIIEEQKILVDKAYEHLHEKNKEVMDSIRYARRIQSALMTPEGYIEKQITRLRKSK